MYIKPQFLISAWYLCTLQKKKYIHFFKSRGKQAHRLNCFSSKIKSEEGEKGDKNAVEGDGEEAVSIVSGCGKAFRLSAVQHTR